MKLFSNECNSQALKVLVASGLSKIDVPIEFVTPDDQRFQAPRRLPILLLDSGDHVFSSNAATCLLLQLGNFKINSTVLEWLEWEATKLQQAVATYLMSLAAGKKSDAVNDLSALLRYLTEKLGNRQTIVGNSLTAADISVWSTLYPLATEQKLNDILPPAVAKWHSALHLQEEFKDAVSKLKLKSGVEAWAASVPLWISQFSNLSIGSSKETSVTTKEGSRKVAASSKPSLDPVLPVSGKRNILITSALPYVNNVPHLGNIIGCVLSADVFARYCRARGHPTLYISGTDEYGTATETKAIAEGTTPQQICDKYHKIHSQVYQWFNIQFDHFGRTSSTEQTEICQDMFLKLHKNKLTTMESMEQLLCQKCDRFLADRFVEGECPLCGYEDARGDQCDKCGKLVNATELKKPRCKLCQQAPVIRESSHFFLDLPKIEPKLRDWMKVSSTGWTSNASVIAHSWIKDGLKPRCITRDLKWGIPVPLDGYRDKVFYVWFDAPLGYVSMTKCYTEHWEKWWKNPKEVEYFQFMAKDNVPFHAVMFPSAQLGSGDPFTIVNHIMATEYLNYEEGKFSKSRGVGVFGSDVQETGIPADVWRFYLLYVRPENQDSSFSWADLMTKNNSELLNNLGNFINRALMFVEKSFNSVVPKVTINKEVQEVIDAVNVELSSFIEALEKTRLRDGLRHILSISRIGNQFMQASQPWVLVKGSDSEKQQAGSVLGLSANLACLIAALLRPYMPATADVIQAQLAAPQQSAFNIPDQFSIQLKEGHTIGKPAPLFSKIEAGIIETLRARYAGTQESRIKTVPASQTSSGGDVAALQAEVASQGEVVRKLKAETKDKAVWQPEVTKLLELKKRLLEAQANPSPPAIVSGTAPPSADQVAALQAEVAAQGEVVRKLKAETKDKAVWQPEVTKLLELKKRLLEAQANPSPPTIVSGTAPPSADQIAALQAEVAAQGEVVRKLKAETKDKAVWQPEVTKLLELKKKLAQTTPTSATPANTTSASPSQPNATHSNPPSSKQGSQATSVPQGANSPNDEITALTTEVAAQGEVVRKLKSESQDKSVWQPELNKLLELKQRLSQLQGSPPPAASSKSGKKKKK